MMDAASGLIIAAVLAGLLCLRRRRCPDVTDRTDGTDGTACPYCGTAERQVDLTERGGRLVVCKGCGTQVPISHWENRAGRRIELMSDGELMDAKAAGYAKQWEGRAATIVTVLILCALCIPACGASVKLAWNANDPRENVTSYEVLAAEVWGMHEVKLQTPETDVRVNGLKAGVLCFFSVRARNSSGVSDYCTPITGVPLQLFRVTIQKSDDMMTYADTTAVITVRAKSAEFFRGKIEEVME